MDINELESYQKSDAVKFHSKLNPKLWNNEDLHDEVRLRLLDMAADFKEFLGIKDLEVNDVTISGSNAAYNYTGNSDIDLHLVVDMPKLEADEVYRELFTAKKYQYNDQHDYKIGDHEVELYVQPATDQHHSQGIYSVQASDWRRVPSRKKPKIDDTSVRHKYEDLGARIETAVASEDLNTIETLYDKIVNMRSIGLEKTGEFGVENVVFKLLRNAGLIDQLRKKRNDIKDQQLSITEKEKSQTKTNWGKFNGTFFPGHSHNRNARTDVSGSNASGSANETIKEVRRPLDMAKTIKLFLKFCCSELNIDCPSITLKKDPEWSKRNGTFGRYNADNDRIIISIANRHPVDAMRTLAHELIHYAQDQHSPMPSDAGATGSDYENEANAGAGIIMRNFAQKYPEHFTLEEASGFIPSNSKLAHDPRYIMGLTKDIKPGETQRQAAKLGMTIDKKGSPPLLHKTAAKNTTPNKAYNLGLTESVDEGIKSLIKPSAYQLAADTLHTVLQRKQKENNNNFKHSLGWYASKIAGGHESIDTRELVDYYQKNYDTVLSEEEIAAEAYSTEQLDEMWGFAAARRVPSYMRGKVKKKKEKIEPSTHDKLVARRQAAAKGDKEAFRKDFKDLNEALGELPSSTEIYVDMDGVLADFFGEWSKSQGVSNWKDIKDPMKAIGDIKSIDDFWLNLPVLPQAKNLLNLIKKIKGSYNICTSPLADDPRSAPHKREWIKKNLAFFPPKNIYITHNKPQFAKNEDGTPNILVDDYGVNIDAWEAAGGIGFKYKDYKFDRTANAIKQQIDAPVEENFADGKKKEKFEPSTHDKLVARRQAAAKGDKEAFRKSYKDIEKDTEVAESWSEKYKRSIDCNNPKGFSQRAHCAGRKKNESISEGYRLQLERGSDMDVLHITDTKTGHRTEVRGKPNYETAYDANDQLHQLLDRIGKAANISDLINGEPVGINPRYPDGASAKKHADTAFNESFNNPYNYEWVRKMDASWLAIAKTENGSLQVQFQKPKPRRWIINFALGGSYDKTGTGDQFRILATTIVAIRDWFSQQDLKKINSVEFAANKDKDGSSRTKLYTRFAKQMANELGWELVVKTKKKEDTFVIQKPKKVLENFADGKVKGKSRPDGASAKTATDTAFGEDDEQYRNMRRLLVTPEHSLGKYLYHLTGADGLLGMLKDGHLGDHDEYFSMTADPKYDVGGGSGWTKVNIIIDAAKVKKLETFEKHMENWEWGDHGSGDWAKQPGQDWESEYRVEEAIPLDAIVAVKILKSAATPEIIKLAKQRNIKLIGKDTSVQENFADGKKKGKSRPGRVKRSGASCNGSVTALRKRAKNSSGEKAKMYHWCANMKAGKKK